MARPTAAGSPRATPSPPSRGPARGILTAERTALNFLCHLSGIASATAAIADAIAGTAGAGLLHAQDHAGPARAQKYAVRVGGGINHRFGLDDAVLIKDNHVAIAGGIRAGGGARPRRRRPSGEDRARGRYARHSSRRR